MFPPCQLYFGESSGKQKGGERDRRHKLLLRLIDERDTDSLSILVQFCRSVEHVCFAGVRLTPTSTTWSRDTEGKGYKGFGSGLAECHVKLQGIPSGLQPEME